MNNCECTGPGWCERHQVNKAEHWVHLCQTRENYFQAWEEGRGPGQIILDTTNESPNIIQRGINLGKAIVKHVKCGCHHCTDEQKNARFAICQSNRCGFFKVHAEGGICTHNSCGCYIRSGGKFMDKLSWAESKCPKKLWGAVKPIKKDKK